MIRGILIGLLVALAIIFILITIALSNPKSFVETAVPNDLPLEFKDLEIQKVRFGMEYIYVIKLRGKVLSMYLYTDHTMTPLDIPK